MRLTQTHTVVLLELSSAAYQEIRAKLEAAGYHHAFHEEGWIDMTGIGVALEKPDTEPAPAPTLPCAPVFEPAPGVLTIGMIQDGLAVMRKNSGDAPPPTTGCWTDEGEQALASKEGRG
jgi:hypothetical protein